MQQQKTNKQNNDTMQISCITYESNKNYDIISIMRRVVLRLAIIFSFFTWGSDLKLF